MNKVYLLLGSNKQNPKKKLAKAKLLINAQIGKIDRQSSIYETAAWGYTNQPNFLNQVVILQSAFTPSEILQKILTIEKKMGRVRTIKNAPRSIDIDILFYNKEIIKDENVKKCLPSFNFVELFRSFISGLTTKKKIITSV